MASKRIIMKKSHRMKLDGGGELALPNRSHQLLDDKLQAKLVTDGLAVWEQDVLDGKVNAETLEPVASEPVATDTSVSTADHLAQPAVEHFGTDEEQ